MIRLQELGENGFSIIFINLVKINLSLITNMKQLPTDRSADRSTGPISLINYLISEVINFGRM